ncbi:MAG: M64 family metallopeptidase [Actinobacteria bacterium]|nr:M64 family metallopeptidase [Actinomycetota bacterium]
MIDRMLIVLVLGAATGALLAALAAPAAAQEPPTLTVDDILPGECAPTPILIGQYSDCRFPLARPVVLDPFGGPYLADVEGSYDEQNEDRPDCVIEENTLVCRNVPSYYPAGRTGVRIQVGWVGTTGVLAEITTIDYWDVPVTITPVGSPEPYATTHRPLEIWVDKWEHPELVAKIRDRDSGEVVALVPVDIPADTFAPVRLEIDVGALAPGRYRVQPCVPPEGGPADCEEIPGVGYFQVGSGELVEAIPGWNRPGADRINLVLAGAGFADFDAFADTAVALLGFDGPTLLDYDGGVVDGGEVAMVEFGPFATEPIRSYRDRFNIWLLTDLLGDAHAMFWGEPPNGLGFGADGGVLPDAQITAIELLAAGEWSGSEAGFPSFTGAAPGSPDREDLQFAGAYVALPQWTPLAESDTLTHELGHALFDLRDEYTSLDRSIQHGYPNCAPDLASAEAWWGDLAGEVDPWLDEYIAVLEAHGQFFGDAADLRASLAVGYVWGGCYGETGGVESVRPTSESIMNGQTPVFGSVNRRRVEEILGLWSGREVLALAADLEVDCARVAGDPWEVACRGVIAPYVDPPADGLLMVLGSVSDACMTSLADGDEPVAVTCGPLVGAGYESVEVTVGDRTGALVTITLPPIEVRPPPVVLGLGGTPPIPAERPGEAPPWLILGILGAGIPAMVAAMVVVRRRAGATRE